MLPNEIKLFKSDYKKFYLKENANVNLPLFTEKVYFVH